MSIERTEFSSGLRILSDRMPGVRSVTLGVWVGTGSRDEVPRVSGSSHFLEHLVFKGTPKRSALDIAEAFDAVGGDLNAFTTRETTCFYARVVDRDLPMAVEHLCDMLQNAVLRRADLESERQVILEEINMHEDTPDDLIHDFLHETLWPEHPLGRPVLGTARSIKGVSREQVRGFFKRHYRPANFVVAAAGNLRHEDLVKSIRRGMDTGRALPKRRSSGVALDPRRVPKPSGRVGVKRRPTEQAHICIGTNGLARSDRDRFAFGLVNDVLGGGMSSRLFQEIRERRGLAYSVYSYHSMFAETGLFAIYAGTTPRNARKVVDLARKQMEDVASNGLRPEELQRAKGHMEGMLALSLEETSSRMSRVGKSEIAHGEILTVGEMLKRVDAVTAGDAKRAAERVLTQTLSLAVIGPFEEKAFGGALQ